MGRSARLLVLLLGALIRYSSGSTSVSVTQQTCSGLSGKWIGGHCFFIPKDVVDWTKAWKTCGSHNATVAQVHTTAEYQAIQSLPAFKSGVWASYFVAAQTIPGTTGCAVPLATTFWLDSISTHNSKMSASNTWIRNHPCEDSDNGNEDYIVITYYGGKFTIEDQKATGRDQWDNYAVCQASSCSRNFTKGIKGCMKESPIETTIASPSLQDCVQLCGDKLWCRSFDYTPTDASDEMGDGKCELFSFSGLEPAATGPLMGPKNGCLHYDNLMN